MTSILSALVATACCWLPLLLAAFGVAAGGVATAFERVRPAMLAIAPILLGFGFYRAYFRREQCGEACTGPSTKLVTLNRALLWIATAIVLVVALFPGRLARLFRTGAEVEQGPGGPSVAAALKLRIEGMTCEACAVHVEEALRAVPGVRSANVDYAQATAVVVADAATPPAASSLVEAIARLGYRARLEEER